MVKIAVVGSLMMDLVVRAPRLALAGESLIGHSFETFVGGKGGNQATAAARLGADVTMIGRVGDDDFGRTIRAQLAHENVDTRHVTADSGEGTGVAVPIVLDDGSNVIYALPRANLRLSPSDIAASEAAIAAADMLVLQFETGMQAVLTAMRIAREHGVPVLLNPAPIAQYPPEVLELATVIVANEIEASALAPSANGDHRAESLAFLDMGAELAVVTLGADGATFATGGSVHHQAPFAVEAVDSVGAGDAFCGALAVALSERMPPAGAVRFAAAAGALAVTKLGATGGLPTRGQTDTLLRRR